ncbi:PP2C family serine/threonine-protein phosphatase [Kitasatospora purpeofusca]|uniref:PP2C family serine/threonine-protein phosphatase n=1 Tax=Kitasatospora purpeofusca TaxID=67352 RepID=UPI00366523B7
MRRTTLAPAAVATAVGTSGITGDAAYVHRLATGAVGTCVVDGIGHSPRITARAALLAEVGARIAGTRGPLHGILAAAELISDPGPDDAPEEDAVAVAAAVHPGSQHVQIAWTGDCAAWAYDPDSQLMVKTTTDQTMGAYLRTVNPGGPSALAEHHDAWVRASLARSSIATVRETEVTSPLVLLTTDGVHDVLTATEISQIVQGYLRGAYGGGHDEMARHLIRQSQAIAAKRGGEVDDATVVVLALLQPSA